MSTPESTGLPPGENRLVEYYCRRAPSYEQIYYRDDPVRQKELAAESQRVQELAADRQVLDIPCGTGYWLQRMSASARSIVAADISREMLIEARRKEAGCPVDLVQSSLEQLPFSPGAFDLIALGFWLSHQPRQTYAVFFESIAQLAGRDGLIWMIDNNPSAEGNGRDPVGYDEFGNHHTRRRLPDGREFVILKNYFTEPELREVFGRRFRIERLSYGECYWSVVLRVGRGPVSDPAAEPTDTVGGS
ncbi:MAG: class I SAM-dependent methyltransferase [bacterium]